MATPKTHDSGHVIHYKQYLLTWFWLLVMTLLALALGYAPMPEGIKALLLVGITLAKIVLIASIFMHLKFERMNLIMMTFSSVDSCRDPVFLYVGRNQRIRESCHHGALGKLAK